VKSSQRLVAARTFEHHEEVPFALVEHREGAPRTVVTGTIDLVHRTAGGWRVIDYKTDVDEGALAERYAVQVEAYRQAWGKVVGASVEKEIVAARKT
jgi:ATP-dependent exoDNAse (exonuclease V) beta subunit